MKLRMILFAIGVWVLRVAVTTVSAQEPVPLRIYFLDGSGGAMTLIVTPLGESVLIDAGPRDGRHVERVLLACEDANVVEIDHLVTTHFDSDHFGAIEELATRIPIRRFYDKGSGSRDGGGSLPNAYEQATLTKQVVLGAGDEIALAQDRSLYYLKLYCLAANQAIDGFEGDIDAPVEGFSMIPEDDTDKGNSIVLLLTYGSFTFFAGADITWNLEHHLVHPENRIGQIDLYAVSNHGLDTSNNPLLLQAIEATACVASNGPTQGIMPRVFTDLKMLPSMQAIYQLHYNTQLGDDGNTDSDTIANRRAESGHWVKASVFPDREIFEIELSRPAPGRVFPIVPIPGVMPPPRPDDGGGRRR